MENFKDRLVKNASQIILGHEDKIEKCFVSLICQGHLLIEDIPGVGKTTLAKTLGKLLDLKFSRIQFTNDLLPSDILGTYIFKRESEEFVLRKGPVFTNILFADEINRSPARTQSALLEVMQERKVTIEGNSYYLEDPFIVMATQNPIGHLGTFPLPESQRDRFFMGISLGIPTRENEIKILKQKDSEKLVQECRPCLEKGELKELQFQIDSIDVSDNIFNYIIDILDYLRYECGEPGLSPRAAKALTKASKALALINSRNYVIPEDVKEMSPYVLGHRLKGQLPLIKGQQKINEALSKITVR